MAMRRLMLLRHAKSDWSQPGKHDHERELAPRGRKAALRMGEFMAREGLLPDCALVSTAQRTRETWALVRDALDNDPFTYFDERIYEASPGDILLAIRETPAATEKLLVVGHNPGLQALAIALIGSGDIESRARLAEKFPTAGLAVIDFPRDDWSELAPGTGRLALFVSPRMLAEAAD
jgi:phosphohistidine phosphatase